MTAAARELPPPYPKKPLGSLLSTVASRKACAWETWGEAGAITLQSAHRAPRASTSTRQRRKAKKKIEAVQERPSYRTDSFSSARACIMKAGIQSRRDICCYLFPKVHSTCLERKFHRAGLFRRRTWSFFSSTGDWREEGLHGARLGSSVGSSQFNSGLWRDLIVCRSRNGGHGDLRSAPTSLV